MSKEILIASSSYDVATVEPVATELERNGMSVTVYQADRVFSREVESAFSIDENGNPYWLYGDSEDISPGAINAAWYRRPNIIATNEAFDGDAARMLSVEREVRELHSFMWGLFSEDVWLNSPQAIRKAENKLGQLVLASSLGLKIPHSFIGNHWESVQEEFMGDDLILKVVNGVYYVDGIRRTLYSTKLDTETVKSQDNLSPSPFPGIIQNYIGKYREWRLTVIDDEVFSTAIYTTEDAKDDWRKHQNSSSVTFRQEEVDEEVSEKSIDILRETDLKFGTFDFIETADGEYVFLELNSNGQYIWLEEMFNLPISHLISKKLIEIAIENT